MIVFNWALKEQKYLAEPSGAILQYWSFLAGTPRVKPRHKIAQADN
jgi:hypothetical protein